MKSTFSKELIKVILLVWVSHKETASVLWDGDGRSWLLDASRRIKADLLKVFLRADRFSSLGKLTGFENLAHLPPKANQDMFTITAREGEKFKCVSAISLIWPLMWRGPVQREEGASTPSF